MWEVLTITYPFVGASYFQHVFVFGKTRKHEAKSHVCAYCRGYRCFSSTDLVNTSQTTPDQTNLVLRFSWTLQNIGHIAPKRIGAQTIATGQPVCSSKAALEDTRLRVYSHRSILVSQNRAEAQRFAFIPILTPVVNCDVVGLKATSRQLASGLAALRASVLQVHVRYIHINMQL